MPRLTPFAPNLWLAEGPVVPFWCGMPYPTRMAVVRLANGTLWVWSPVEMDADLRREVDALGPVAHLVAPNLLHHLFASAWKEAYPHARLYAAPGLRRKRPDLPFDADLTDTPDPAWYDQIDQLVFEGSVAMREVVFFHRASQTLILTDLIENFPAGWFCGWHSLLARLAGIVAPQGGAPRDFRLSFLAHRRTARACLERMLAWPITRVVMAHGELVTTDGKAFTRRAFTWLLPLRLRLKTAKSTCCS